MKSITINKPVRKVSSVWKVSWKKQLLTPDFQYLAVLKTLSNYDCFLSDPN